MTKFIGGHAQCYGSAVSIVRGFLGYNDGYSIPPAPVRTEEVLTEAQALFPNHKVAVYCSKELAQKIGIEPPYYGGCNFYDDPNDDSIYIFDYHTAIDGISHCVIGYPTLYEGMRCSFIIAIKVSKFDGLGRE